MSQVYNQSNNEFIFGDKGGRGKHLLLFLKNLSLTGSSLQASQNSSDSSIREVNSNIYGNLSYGYTSPDTGGSTIPVQSQALGKLALIPMPRFPRSLSLRSVSLNGQIARTSTSPDVPPSRSVSRLSSPFHKQVSRTISSSGERSFRKPTYTDLDDDWDAEIDKADNEDRKGRFVGIGGGERKSSVPMVDSLYPDLTMSGFARPSGEIKNKDLMDSQDLQTKVEVQKLNQLHNRFLKFRKVITEDANSINILDLRRLSWNGVPPELRAMTWQLLLGYLPTNKTRQSSTLKRKRQEYSDGLNNVTLQILFEDNTPNNNSSVLLADSSNKDNSVNKEKQLYHQINIDVKRTNPTLKLYSYPETQKSLRKILYLWAVRHPASGYVQGINDLCTPFYQIFLNNYLWQLQRKRAHEFDQAEDDSLLFIPGLIDDTGSDALEKQLYNDPKLMIYTWENIDTALISPRVTAIIEADTYWCLSRLLDNITDNYIHEQPGILKQVSDLRNLISKIDLPLIEHLESEGVEFIQFSFRWMNCLLMRELSIGLIIRMWDTYLSETPLGFNNFHVYVCAAFLIKFSGELKQKDFQEILLFLQNPPTATWKEKDIELMLSEAFIWQSLYKNALAHLR
ncbi:CIC11C00000003744 [Sungouiella intermedia]|uniref:CIC11C00000003744 n=1 Tax=Sungouiella intermedia TaxID=45354 RepID=A0A1L0BE55_9ASCO|nr:CIC11C00000003744 [[Candida] intermedia]